MRLRNRARDRRDIASRFERLTRDVSQVKINHTHFGKGAKTRVGKLVSRILPDTSDRTAIFRDNSGVDEHAPKKSDAAAVKVIAMVRKSMQESMGEETQSDELRATDCGFARGRW